MAELWLSLIVTSVACGYLGRAYAIRSGRDPFRWAILGVALNIGVLAAMIVIGSSKGTPKR
jgi:VIT1/CCC1 family predicted Fe2+/Mn2+ transporter